MHKILETGEKLYNHFFLEHVILINGDLYYKSASLLGYYGGIEESLMSAIFGDKIFFPEKNYLTDLRILKIQYASPGRSDFFGIGQIIKEVFKTIRHYFPNNKDKLRMEILEQSVLRKKIENLKAIGYTPKEIKLLIASSDHSLKTLTKLESEKKLVSAKLTKLEQ